MYLLINEIVKPLTCLCILQKTTGGIYEVSVHEHLLHLRCGPRQETAAHQCFREKVALLYHAVCVCVQGLTLQSTDEYETIGTHKKPIA